MSGNMLLVIASVSVISYLSFIIYNLLSVIFHLSSVISHLLSTTIYQLKMSTKNNPVWLITGCSTGFGRELAKLILTRGWNAVITARNPEQIKDIAAGYEDSSLLLALDVTNKQQVKEAVDKAVKNLEGSMCW